MKKSATFFPFAPDLAPPVIPDPIPAIAPPMPPPANPPTAPTSPPIVPPATPPTSPLRNGMKSRFLVSISKCNISFIKLGISPANLNAAIIINIIINATVYHSSELIDGK